MHPRLVGVCGVEWRAARIDPEALQAAIECPLSYISLIPDRRGRTRVLWLIGDRGIEISADHSGLRDEWRDLVPYSRCSTAAASRDEAWVQDGQVDQVDRVGRGLSHGRRRTGRISGRLRVLWHRRGDIAVVSEEGEPKGRISDIKEGDCVQIPDGRIGRVRGVSAGQINVRVRRKTSNTHQFILFPPDKLERVDCPAGWMSPKGYNRYLDVTLEKMRERNKRRTEE